eukprot:PITA_32599
MPRNVTELRGFLSIFTYHRRFVRGFSQLAASLMDLTKKGAFEWTQVAQEAFERLKKVMSNYLVLALSDFKRSFVLECDASGERVGAVLMQGGYPIAFESRKLLPHERLYSIYEKEMLVVMHALAKLRQYLEGNRFKGKKNIVTEALSQRPTTLSLMDVTQDWKAQLLVEYSKDRQACEILDGTYGDDRFRVMDDVIYYKDRIYLVPGSQLKDKIMQVAHDSPLAGHPRFLKTYHAIKERFSWRDLKGDILRHV